MRPNFRLQCMLRRPELAHSLSKMPRKHLYHSHEHAIPPPFPSSDSAILSAGLKHVPEFGFTIKSLSRGAEDAGYLPISTNLFPSGAYALVNYHLVTNRIALATHFQRPKISHETNAPPRDLSKNIQDILLHRLYANSKIIPQYQNALALLSLSANLSSGLKELARLADEILYLAGSTTVTTAWYTDRAALSAIYASAELYMTRDHSKGFANTADFVAQRLQEGESLRSGVGMMGQWMGMQAGGLLDGLRSKGVWI